MAVHIGRVFLFLYCNRNRTFIATRASLKKLTKRDTVVTTDSIKSNPQPLFFERVMRSEQRGRCSKAKEKKRRFSGRCPEPRDVWSVSSKLMHKGSAFMRRPFEKGGRKL